MSDAISIVASANHAGGGALASVDVSEYCSLRLDLTVASCSATGWPRLEVWLEHSPNGTSWERLVEFVPMTEAGTQRIILTNFDSYVRASFFARAQNLATDPAIVWSLTGTALPEA